jgi:hypothetical protein
MQMLDKHNQIYHQGASEDLQHELELRKSGQLTTPIDIGGISSKNQQRARYAVGGPMDANWVTLAKSVERKQGGAAARSFTNALALNLKDYKNPAEHLDTNTVGGFYAGKKAGGMAPYSPLKQNVKMAGVDIKDTRPSFTPSGKGQWGGPLETVSNVLHGAMAPLAAIAHTGTTVNAILGTDTKTFLKSSAQAMTFQLGQNIDKTEALYHTGVFAEHYLDAATRWNRFKADGNTAWIKGTAGEFLYKMYHTPGFRPVRDYNLLMGVNAAKQTAEDAALKFMRSGGKDKQYMWALSQMNINPKDVLSQGGQLNQSQLEAAIYKYVDRHVFIDNTMHRSEFFQGTPVGRILGMYHAYVTRQAKLMIRSLSDGFRGDQGAFRTARNLAILATVFPTVGEFIKLAQMTIRGQDSVGQGEQDVDNITGENGAGEAVSTYMEALGHAGTFGIYDYLLRGGYTRSISRELLGPTVATGLNTVDDFGKLSSDTVHGKVNRDNLESELAPTARDIFYTVPGLSTLNYVLGHRLLPRSYEDPNNAAERRLYNWFQDTETKDSKHKETKLQPMQ